MFGGMDRVAASEQECVSMTRRQRVIVMIAAAPAAVFWIAVCHIVSGVLGRIGQLFDGWLSVPNFTELIFAIGVQAPLYLLWWRWFRRLRPVGEAKSH